jgi:hypothetical protein
MRWSARGVCAVSGALTLLGADRAPAQPADVESCVQTHERALTARREGKLTRAYADFAECTQTSCPTPVRQECATQVRQLEAIIPTVVLSARVRGGEELAEVRVELDSAPLADRLDGRAHRIDPGPHTFRFEAAGHRAIDVKAMIAEGDRLRKVEAVWEPSDGGSSRGSSRATPLATYVLAGVGAVGLAGFGYFALTGLSKEKDLDQCSPRCSPDETDRLKRTYLFADISLAVGVAALGGATYFYFSSREEGRATGRASTVGLRGRF